MALASVRDLERALEAVPPFPAPSPELEQYRTPAAVAAGLLHHAHRDGAIAGRRVLDLGCGTGVFALGAALLGATHATGLDADAGAVALAHEAAHRAGVAERCSFHVADLRAWTPPAASFDTVVMNPPFGAQAGNRHGDRLFLDRAAQAVGPASRAGGRDGPGNVPARTREAGTVWFLALERTEGFLAAAARAHEAHLERVAQWDYPILAQFAFHEKEAHVVRVGGYRMGWDA